MIMFSKQIIALILFSNLFVQTVFSQQIANYVSNGSFEKLYDCQSQLSETTAISWACVDSTKFCAFLYNVCAGFVPATGIGYQMPKEGKGFIRLELFCPNCSSFFTRSNIKNRLKRTLVAGRTYCAKFFVNLGNIYPVAIDGFGLYFADSSIDTIIYNSRLPLSFLNPQISNPTGNFINDTLNWSAVTGTFIATGNEKYMVVTNFKSDAATNTISTGMPNIGNGCEYFVDAISCIDIDLPAYAGPSNYFLLGDSVYIGRESDVEIDESCIWYKMTSPTTSVTIDTIAGMWVKPVATTTYVVRQQLWCSGVKWDTVVVHLSGVGIKELKVESLELKVWPNPANDVLQFKVQDSKFNPAIGSNVEGVGIIIFNSLGQMVREEKITFKNKSATLSTFELKEGVYSLEMRIGDSYKIKKRFVIAR